MSNTDQENHKTNQQEAVSDQQKPPSFGQVMLSAIAAAFGVQSSKNQQRDFSTSSPAPYIIAGILFTLGFIATLVIIVMLVLH